MPELPEAEVVRRQLRTAIRGAAITRLWIGREDIVRQGAATRSWYTRARVTDVRRHGKSVALVCERNAETRVLIVELGMTGLLLFERAAAPSERHVHMALTLTNGSRVRYWNARRFGGLYLLDGDEWHAYRARRFGLDPLTMTDADFLALLRSCRGRVKALLLQQPKIAGLGNIYVNEALFRAGIHPHARAHDLSTRRIQRLCRETRAVLTEAIRLGGSSIRDFVAPNGRPGRFQRRHLIYGKPGAPCPNGCRTVIRRLADARTSFVCPTCQRR